VEPDCGRQALLLDQHPIWLDAVETVLRRVGIEVVGKAVAADEVLPLLATLQPSLLIGEIDTSRPENEGLRLLRAVRADHPDVRVIVLSRRDDAESITQALAAGATAYVVKTAHPDDLAVAVRQAHGQSLFFASGRDHATPSPAASVPDHIALTRRETEILRLVGEGKSNRQLARALWVTEQTVKFHLSNVYRKLDVSNRTEASRWAQLHGLGSVEAPPPAPSHDGSGRSAGLEVSGRP
jgi:DNA-binding NarL/FixJ family response regulator